MNNSHILKCPYCNYNSTSFRKGACFSSLIGHVSRQHKINAKELRTNDLIDESYIVDHRAYTAEASKKRLRDPERIKKETEKLRLKIGDDEFYKLPECQICKFRGKQLYKHISTIHDMKVDDYKKQFEERLETDEYIKYLTESRIGDKNPMYGNGKSELSPWSEEFYMRKGFSIEESIIKKQEFIQTVQNNKGPKSEPTRIEYYMNKYNIDEEHAADMVYKRQQTNTVQAIANRNDISIDEAKIVRDKITAKWMNTMNSKSPEEMKEIVRTRLRGSNSISAVSIKFFENLIDTEGIDRSEVLMGSSELILYTSTTDTRRYRAFDFTYKNKIIEYNGDRTHANPAIYKPDDTPHKHMIRFNKDKTAQEIWDYDKHKIELAKSKDYEVLVIWHSDIKKNVYRELRNCKEFLESETIK